MMLSRKEKAYTLVEILIAALFIGIALITMAAAFTNSSHILQKSRHTLTALGYLQNYAEYVRNLPFSGLTNSTPDISPAPLNNPQLFITVESYDADNDGSTDSDIKKVSLRISWTEAGTTIFKKTVTLVTKKGLNPDE